MRGARSAPASPRCAGTGRSSRPAAEHVGGLLAVLRAALDEGSAGPGRPPPAQSARRERAGVQHIPVGSGPRRDPAGPAAC